MPKPPNSVVVLDDRTTALSWLERHVDTLASYASALHGGGEHQQAWYLVDVLWPLWLHRKHYVVRLELDTLALRAAKVWDDEAAQAKMLTVAWAVSFGPTRGGLTQPHLPAVSRTADSS
jgi:hypothetical protein